MSEPPALPEPIKPPRGDFSLEERKWREGITKAVNNISVKSLGEMEDVSLTNPSANQILKHDGLNWVNESPTIAWSDIDEKPNFADVATSGEYNDLSNIPTIPTSTSQLNNDSNFISDPSYVHSDNNFTTTLKDKLDGIASGAEVNVQANWAQTDTTADDYVKNKPTIPAAANSGTYTLKINGSNKSPSINANGTGSNTIDLGSYLPSSGGTVNGTVVATTFKTGDVTIQRRLSNSGSLEINWSSSGSARTVLFSANDMYPSASNTINCGGNSGRWKKIYSNSGSIDTSDRRAKDNIEPLENALEKLNTIVVNSFTMIGDDKDHIHFGFIAQDELQRNPELVWVPERYSENDSTSGMLGVINSNVLFLAVKAIQELSSKVRKLEEQNGRTK